MYFAEIKSFNPVRQMRTLLLSFSFLLPTLAFSQNYYDSTLVPKKEVFVRLKDGTSLRGKLLSSQNRQIRLQTQNLGEITLDMERIADISEADGYTKGGVFYFRNPFYTNYFISPTAMTLRQGEASYQNTYIFFNGVNFGVTDALTIGGGALLLPGTGPQVFFLTPKVCFNRNSPVKVAVGTIAATAFYSEYTYSNGGSQRRTQTGFGGLAYGAVTFGNEERNGTLTAGWAYGSNGFVSSTPVFTASYMARVGRKAAFLTENWLIPNGGDDFLGGLLSGGIRLFGERIGGDLGLWIPVGTGIGRVTLSPYAALKAKFGKRKNAGN